MKKICICFLVSLLLIGMLPGMAAEKLNLLENGSFEMASGGIPSFWTLSGGEAGKEFTLIEDAADGKTAIKLHSENGKSIFIANFVRDLIPGETYTVTGKVKLPEGSESFAAKVEQVASNGVYVHQKDYAFDYMRRGKRWQDFSFEFQVTNETHTSNILLRSLKGAEIHFDNIRVTGRVEPSVQTCEFVETLPDAPNLVENGGFEIKEGNGAAGWKAHGGNWDGLATIVEEEGRGNVLRLADYGSKNPWGMQLIKNLEEGATYQVTAELKTMSVAGKVRFKTEFYKDNTHSSTTMVTQGERPAFVPTKGEWHKVATTFTIPVGANSLCLYPRMYGAGEVYYDNIEMKMVTKAPYLHIGSDAFVYPDWEKAEAYADFNDAVYEKEAGSAIAFTLLDGDKVLDKAIAKDTEYAIYAFDTNLLAEKAKKYIIRMAYVGADGKVIASYDEPIYKYDRPSRLTKDGRFITADGTPIQISMGYHPSMDHVADAKEIGINALQINANVALEGTKTRLDKLWENGIYAFLELYGNMKPAAHPDNIEHTIEVVNTFKDHPAVLGYMVMDEPFLNDPTCYEHLRNSYKLFRDLDPEKPVYMVECQREWLYKSVTTCDIAAIDPYPGKKPYQTHVADFTRAAERVNTHNKPIMHILQCHVWEGWQPEPQNMRHMAYQAFFAGASAVGYYPLSDKGGLLYDNAKTRKGFLYEGVKFFMQEEYEDAFRTFVTEEYPSLSELSSDRHAVWHKAYIKDGSIYVVLLNRTENEQTVSVPLTSGGVTVGDFTAVGADLLERDSIQGTGTLTVSLKPFDVVRYKIETDMPISAELLSQSAFTDVAEYAWAEKAIGAMSSIGVTDVTSGTYKPGEAITRGAFAMFLVRALGLSNEPAAQFADVDPSAAYAKELAIGRGAGILNGIGNDLYSPEAQITRQEMMTIIARGMNLTGEADLSRFSDNDKIADWAKASVSAMVESGLIAGNADGTLQPLGNTTRAEAAVIMERIITATNTAEVKYVDYAVPWLDGKL